MSGHFYLTSRARHTFGPAFLYGRRRSPVDWNVDKPHEISTQNRQTQSPTAPQSVTIEGESNKNGHEGATNTLHGLTHSNGMSKGGAEMIVTDHASTSATDYALQFLKFAADDYTESIDRREYYAVAAKRLGISHQQIADIYHLTEGAVRAMIKRAGDRQ